MEQNDYETIMLKILFRILVIVLYFLVPSLTLLMLKFMWNYILDK